MRKLIAAALAVVLMVMVAAPAAQAGDATAQAALGLAAFAVFSQFVIPLLAGQPAYAPAPVPAPVYYYPPSPAYYPPPPVVERPYVDVDPRWAPRAWDMPDPVPAPQPGYRSYGYVPQGPAGHYANQGRYERGQWAGAHRGRPARSQGLQPQ